MERLSEIKNTDLHTKLFVVLAITGCISNIAGFTANAVIFGFTVQTVICAVCATIVIVSSLAGFISGRTYVATFIILLVPLSHATRNRVAVIAVTKHIKHLLFIYSP